MSWLVNLAGRFRFELARCFTAALGICSIAWAISSIVVYRSDVAFADPAQHILSGDKYSAAQLGELKVQLDAARGKSHGPSALNDIAVIRLRLAETEPSGKTAIAASGLDDAEAAVIAALAENPTGSFLWLADYWLQGVRTGAPDRGINLLRMSYSLGPNEGWIAARRNALALGIFPSLPDELAERALAEFAGLVRSGLYLDAANILAGSGWAARDKLMPRLAQIDEGDRRRFARILDAKNLDGAMVPGLGERPF